MAQLLSSSAPPRFHHLAAAPGHGRGSRLSVTPACSASSGSLVRMRRGSTRRRSARSLTVRCEQGAKGGGGGGGLDVWLSRGAMLGFVGAVTVELTTGKGVLQNVGLTSPVPTLALALTGVVGVAAAFLIFQSASRD
ncbi:stress enhanced protein 1, chloroplastic-like [Oryza brachyantha]|uniref:Stress enhanced protein 1 n=1 Tax=Oryza brachyantha TaxID=4533 RepID=J3N2E2_ORYBR|nr:stress enhanced protein 1, chloroplastic-like [Oryza brachyantha]